LLPFLFKISPVVLIYSSFIEKTIFLVF